MKFGIQHPNYSYDGQGAQVVDTLKTLTNRAETLGYDSFWVMDHLHQIPYVGRPEEPMLEGWTTISVLAGMTSKIKLGTLVTGNSYRHPSILAKVGATLDVLSKGRLFMGIGAAWNDEEARAYGIPFPPTSERLERLDEAVQIIRKMWTEDKVNFDGKYYKLQNALCNPKPIQKPHPKILIGGAGEKMLLRTVAKHGDACNLFGSPETVKKKLAILREHCKAVGRDYDSILKTKLTQTMIDSDGDAVEKRAAEMSKMMPPGMLKEAMIYGNPDQIRSQVEEFRAAGIEYLIMSFSGPSEL
ncbi:MAG: LLM class F420-dependent oxidoreductase, partial [Thaumarchaeota archaeon]|nr:LLM class F420-dependent oxidoreductase [Nitrososphaerota archaeon]